jgi:hypothetical protein
MNIVTAHPKLVTLGIALGITFVIGTALGMLDHNQAFALGTSSGSSSSSRG